MRMRIKAIISIFLVVLVAACAEMDSGLGGGQGQGGSTTRFAINGNHLYVASQQTILVYDISTTTFEKVGEVNVGFGLETISTRGQYLYLGAQDAMYIYGIEDPDHPTFIFRYSHIVSCDPVVVEGNRAYVTLSSGAVCNRGTNALEIIDISDPTNPTLLANYPLYSPLGLGIRNNILFVCEQDYGFKMFDVTNPLDIELLDSVEDIHAYDVIVSDVATITGNDGVYQYGYAGGNLVQLSVIPVNSEE